MGGLSVAKRMVVRGEQAEITVELEERPVANEMWGRLPMKSKARLRGEAEVHFPVLVSKVAESPDNNGIEVGDVAYWPEGNALCIFRAPASGDSPRVAEDFTKVGWVVDGLESSGSIRANEELRIEAAQ